MRHADFDLPHPYLFISPSFVEHEQSLFNINYFIDGFVGNVDASRDISLRVTGTFTVRCLKVFCCHKVTYGLIDQDAVQTQFVMQAILSPLYG